MDMLFDRVIDVTFRNYTTTLEFTEYNDTNLSDVNPQPNERRDFPIKCPRTGPKPDISFRVTMLPGQICHDMTLSITNFSAEVNITEFLEVEITAGYEPLGGEAGQSYTFICPIFSSYVESPNPNGRTTFKGVVVGSMQKLLTPYAVELVFNEHDVTLKELCEKVIMGLGLNVEFDWPEKVSNLKFHVDRKHYVGKTGYATINWLANQLYQLSQAEGAPLPKENTITFNWDGDTVKLGIMGYTSDQTSLRIVDLTQVTAASVQGGTINVKAPWNPRVRPGSVFRMETRYFRGRMSPNQALPQLLSPTDFYNVIKLDLTFGTVDGNEMSILAIPVLENGEATFEVEDEEETAEVKAASAPEDEVGTVITFGTASEDNNNGDVYQVNIGDPFSMQTYTVQAGDTLAGLAAEWYRDIHFVKTEDSDGARLLDIPPGGTMPSSGYSGSYFWPVIYFATVKAMESDDSYYINRSNPNDLQIGKNIVRPAFSDPSEIQNGAELFRTAAGLWDELDRVNMAFNDGGCADDFRRIAYFLEVE